MSLDDRPPAASEHPDTRNLVRRLTGPDPGAVAVFQLRGREALAIAARHFQGRGSLPLDQQPVNKILFGFWWHDLPEDPPARVDELTVESLGDGPSGEESRVDGPTGGGPRTAQPSAASPAPGPETALREDVVFCWTDRAVAELHTHGSPAVVESIFNTFRRHGVPVQDAGVLGTSTDHAAQVPIVWLSPEEARACLEPDWFVGPSGPSDPEGLEFHDSLAVFCRPPFASVTEAMTSVSVDDPTASAAGLMRWLQSLAYHYLQRCSASAAGGRLFQQLRGALLLELLAVAGACQSGDRVASAGRLRRLLGTWSVGQFLSRDATVLFSGPPNVGKSSLINALVGYQRVVVSPVAGTTRDLVGQSTQLLGWPFRLIDSAGLRETIDDLERQGIQQVRQAMQQVDLVVHIGAVDQPAVTQPEAVSPAAGQLWVLNKIDLRLVPDRGPEAGIGTGSPADPLRTSVVTGQGIPVLMEAIAANCLPAECLDPSAGASGGIPPGIVFCPEMRPWLLGLLDVLEGDSPI